MGSCKLTTAEIIERISTESPDECEALFAEAAAVRDGVFGGKVFLYGFVYFSTWCRNDCNFCYYGKSNSISRYRKDADEVVALAEALAASGVQLIDLTMGEDPAYYGEGHATVLDIARRVKSATGLPVMLSPGVVDAEVIDACAALGVEWFALYQETHNKALFSRLRAGQDYELRLRTKQYAARKGMLIEEGILTGVGESCADIAESIRMMGELNAAQMRVMSFVPQAGSPMQDKEKPDILRELKIIAAMRLCYPRVLIPASLDVDGIAGLKRRLAAGANVVTSIIPPRTGLAGVAQSSMDVDEGGRTVAQVTRILREAGMRPATAAEYREYLSTL